MHCGGTMSDNMVVGAATEAIHGHTIAVGGQGGSKGRGGNSLLELIARSPILLILVLISCMSPWTLVKGSGPVGRFPKSGPPKSAGAVRDASFMCSRTAHLFCPFPPAYTRPCAPTARAACSVGVHTKADTWSRCCIRASRKMKR